MAHELRSKIPDATARVRRGVTWEVPLEETRRGAYDLIAKLASGLTRQGRVCFGSTALHLFGRATCPGWVVGEKGMLPNRILAAVDPAGNEMRQQAALRIVDHALAIGQLSGAPVYEVANVKHLTDRDLLVAETRVRCRALCAASRTGTIP